MRPLPAPNSHSLAEEIHLSPSHFSSQDGNGAPDPSLPKASTSSCSTSTSLDSVREIRNTLRPLLREIAAETLLFTNLKLSNPPPGDTTTSAPTVSMCSFERLSLSLSLRARGPFSHLASSLASALPMPSVAPVTYTPTRLAKINTRAPKHTPTKNGNVRKERFRCSLSLSAARDYSLSLSRSLSLGRKYSRETTRRARHCPLSVLAEVLARPERERVHRRQHTQHLVRDDRADHRSHRQRHLHPFF